MREPKTISDGCDICFKCRYERGTAEIQLFTPHSKFPDLSMPLSEFFRKVGIEKEDALRAFEELP